jgi:hypothetical protein
MCNCTSGNLEIPGSREDARTGMTATIYFFKCLAKNAMLRGQAISALALS